MKRKALIIGAAYDDPKILGVYTDMETWYDFLQSNLGGAWRPSELLSLRDPSIDEVQKGLIAAGECEYSFIIFCGHGELIKLNKPWRETVINFGHYGNVSESQINPKTPWCTLLFDCCRLAGEFSNDLNFLIESKSASVEVRSSTRELFDKTLENSEKGLVKVFAASPGEAAEDEKSFSKQLVHLARAWMATGEGVLRLDAAVALAAQEMKQILPQQNPEYLGGRRHRHFPFAINV